MFGPATPVALGVNLPWITYGCDFGRNAWQPDGGLAARGVSDSVARAFEALAASGVSFVRWFLLCDGRAGIRFDRDRPIGIDPAMFADVDAAVALARTHGLRIVFVLFDFHWCRQARVVNGVQLGGRRRSIVDRELRSALLDTVVEPLLARYSSDTAVAAWDVINEPEWVTFRLGTWNPFGTVRRGVMRAFIDDVIARARAISPKPVTVGLASAQWLGFVRGADLDFYQVHWYDRVEDGRLPRSVGDFTIDRPLVLGEFPTRGSAHTPEAIVDVAARSGYAAAWSWSLLADDASTDREAAFRAVAADTIARRRAPGAAEVA